MEENPLSESQFAELKRLLDGGNKIEAIKRYRELTGTSLADAKEAVEGLESGNSPDPENSGSNPTGADLADVVSALKRGKKIEAIRRYREMTGVGLKEAKEAVEAMKVERAGTSSGHPHAQKSGCGASVFLTGLLLAALYWIG